MRFSLYFFFSGFSSLFFTFQFLPLCVLFECLHSIWWLINTAWIVGILCISFIFGTTSQHILHSEKSLLPFRVRISIRDNWIFVHYLRCVTFLPSIFLVMVNQMWHNCLRYSTLFVDKKILPTFGVSTYDNRINFVRRQRLRTDKTRDSDSRTSITLHRIANRKWFGFLHPHETATNTPKSNYVAQNRFGSNRVIRRGVKLILNRCR